jgi:hypothetical protein
MCKGPVLKKHISGKCWNKAAWPDTQVGVERKMVVGRGWMHHEGPQMLRLEC